MNDYKLIAEIEKIINDNVKFMNYEGYEIDKETLTDDILKLIKKEISNVL